MHEFVTREHDAYQHVFAVTLWSGRDGNFKRSTLCDLPKPFILWVLGSFEPYIAPYVGASSNKRDVTLKIKLITVAIASSLALPG